MAESKKTNRELFLENIYAKHPEFQTDEEAAYQYAMDNYKSKKDDLGMLQESSNRLLDVMEKNPYVANMMEMYSKYPNRPDLALKQFDRDILSKALNEYDTEEDEEDLNNDLARYREAGNREKERQKRAAENMKASDEILAKVADELGVKPEDIVGQMTALLQDVADGRISEDTARAFARGLNADAEIAKAKEEGELNGRNAQIEETTQERVTDGLPIHSSSVAAVEGSGNDDSDPYGVERNDWLGQVKRMNN